MTDTSASDPSATFFAATWRRAVDEVDAESADDPGPDTMGYVTPGCDVGVQDASGVLSAHPGVLEAAVVGAPDDVRHELPRTSVGKIRKVVLKEACA